MEEQEFDEAMDVMEVIMKMAYPSQKEIPEKIRNEAKELVKKVEELL